MDKFHGIRHTERLAEFCRTARRVFDRDTIVSLSYASRPPDQGLEPVHALAAELDGVIDWSPVLHRYLLVTPDLTMTLNWNHLAPVERAERFHGGWDGTWFEEDYCEGGEELGEAPAQDLIVTESIAKNVAAEGITTVVLHLFVGLEGILRCQNVCARAEFFAASEASEIERRSNEKRDAGRRVIGALRAIHDAVSEFQVFETNTVREFPRREVRTGRVRRSVIHVGERLIDTRVKTTDALILIVGELPEYRPTGFDICI